MGTENKPASEKIPGVSEYRRAHKFLTEFTTHPSYRLISKHKSVAVRTSAVGLELGFLLMGGGKELIIGMKKQWEIEGKAKYAHIRAVYIPQDNEVCVNYAERGTPDDIIDGHVIYIPVRTSEYSIYQSKILPFLELFKNRSSMGNFNPAEDRFRSNHILQDSYVQSLRNSVSALLEILPKPR